MLNKKEVKAQVTVFIIIGLIILILVGLYFGVKSIIDSDKPDVPDPLANKEAAIIKDYVDNCVYQVGKQAIIKVGEQSGYTEIPGSLKFNPLPYKSDLFYNEIYSLPYWYHFSEDNVFKSHKPALCSYSGDCGIVDFGEGSVQENIENYLNKNIDSCINNFKSFDNVYDIFIKGDKEFNVQIINDKVIINFNYPIDVKSLNSNSITNFESFSTELNVPLLQMFVLAMDITEAESNYHFIEDNTLNLITAYSRIDSNALPPMSQMSFFDFDKEIWIRRELEEKIRYEVLPFIGLTKLANARNNDPPIAYADPEYYPFAQGFYNSFIINIAPNQTYNYTVDIYYPDSEIDFFIDNGEEIIKPKTIKGLNPNMVNMFSMIIQEYTFNYHLSYPVIITITDDKAFNGEGYSFSFSLESNIRNNIPFTQNMSFARFEPATRLRLDDPNALVDKNINIKVKDKRSNEPISNAAIIYNCGSEFYVGKTEFVNSEAIFSGKMPYCAVGGFIKVMKQGYGSVIYDYDNNENDLNEVYIDIELWPIKEKSLTFFKRTEEDIDNMQTIGDKLAYKHNLEPGDEIIFTINKIKESNYDDDFPTISFTLVTAPNLTGTHYDADYQREQIQKLYDGGEINESLYEEFIQEINNYEESEVEMLTDNSYSVELIPGDYTVGMTLMTQGPFVISEKTETYCAGEEVLGVCIGEEEEITYDALELSSWVTGEYSFEFTVHENRVYNEGDLIFFVPYLDAPTTWDELSDFNMEEYVTDIDSWKLMPYYE
jgi:hypothetical protein